MYCQKGREELLLLSVPRTYVPVYTVQYSDNIDAFPPTMPESEGRYWGTGDWQQYSAHPPPSSPSPPVRHSWIPKECFLSRPDNASAQTTGGSSHSNGTHLLSCMHAIYDLVDWKPDCYCSCVFTNSNHGSVLTALYCTVLYDFVNSWKSHAPKPYIYINNLPWRTSCSSVQQEKQMIVVGYLKIIMGWVEGESLCYILLLYYMYYCMYSTVCWYCNNEPPLFSKHGRAWPGNLLPTWLVLPCHARLTDWPD